MKRRVFLTGVASVALLTGCQSSSTSTQSRAGSFRTRLRQIFRRRDQGEARSGVREESAKRNPSGNSETKRENLFSRHPSDEFLADYAARRDGGFALPAVPVDKIDKQFLRQRVNYSTSQKPGTVVVDVPKRFLYVVEAGGKAMRYGVGVGRQGFEWEGDAVMQWKRHWPRWTPPDEMIERRPELEKYSQENGGMDPGLDNPLGARALYLFQNGEDTLYRLHGTPEWWSIGKNVSSGCIRLVNQDVIDLYDRVRNGAKVVVLQAGSSAA